MFPWISSISSTGSSATGGCEGSPDPTCVGFGAGASRIGSAARTSRFGLEAGALRIGRSDFIVSPPRNAPRISRAPALLRHSEYIAEVPEKLCRTLRCQPGDLLKWEPQRFQLSGWTSLTQLHLEWQVCSRQSSARPTLVVHGP